MILSTDDLWAGGSSAWSAIVITTNGTTKANGRAVMGRGVAKQALELYPRLDRILGRQLLYSGNHVHILIKEPTLVLVSFPVKHEWHEKASLELITESTDELVGLANVMNWTKVILPRPGCGNGGRSWEEVEPILAVRLDDRFTVTDGSGRVRT